MLGMRVNSLLPALSRRAAKCFLVVYAGVAQELRQADDFHIV